MRRSVGSICRSSRATDRAVGVAVLRKTRLRPGFLWLFAFGLCWLCWSGWSRRALAPWRPAFEWVGQPGPGRAVNPSMGARSAASMPHTVPDRAARPTPDRFMGGRMEGLGLPRPTRFRQSASAGWIVGTCWVLVRMFVPRCARHPRMAWIYSGGHAKNCAVRGPRSAVRSPQSALISQPKP